MMVKGVISHTHVATDAHMHAHIHSCIHVKLTDCSILRRAGKSCHGIWLLSIHHKRVNERTMVPKVKILPKCSC